MLNKNKLEIGQIMSLLAISALIFIALNRWDDPISYKWSRWSLMHACLALISLIFVWNDFKDEVINPIYVVIIFGSLILIQLVFSVITLQISAIEQGLYYIMVAITEELFFRGLILKPYKNIDNNVYKISGIVFSSIVFAIFHYNYWNNISMMLSVLFGGMLLGYIYLKTGSLTTNMLGHFALNILVTLQWYYTVV